MCSGVVVSFVCLIGVGGGEELGIRKWGGVGEEMGKGIERERKGDKGRVRREDVLLVVNAHIPSDTDSGLPSRGRRSLLVDLGGVTF